MFPLLNLIAKIKIEVIICFLVVVHYVIEVTSNVSVRSKGPIGWGPLTPQFR